MMDRMDWHERYAWNQRDDQQALQYRGGSDRSGPAPRDGRLGHGTAESASLGDRLAGLDRFSEEQLFEEDVRAVLSMMRPNRRERLLGWKEFRTGGAHFRATISWDDEMENDTTNDVEERLAIPHLTDVLESILVGSVKNQDELPAAEEFEIYRGVMRELCRRLDEMQSCYE